LNVNDWSMMVVIEKILTYLFSLNIYVDVYQFQHLLLIYKANSN